MLVYAGAFGAATANTTELRCILRLVSEGQERWPTRSSASFAERTTDGVRVPPLIDKTDEHPHTEAMVQGMSRREYLALCGSGAALLEHPMQGAVSSRSMPGPYRGRVVAVEDSECCRGDSFEADRIDKMVRTGMCSLTGTRSPAEAWQRFFKPGDVVGIKTSPIGQPFVCSSPQMLRAIIQGLRSAGVRLTDIVVYERYRAPFAKAGIPGWLPSGVRTATAADDYDNIQQDMTNYDPEHFVDLPMVLPEFQLNNVAARRSYAAQFITKQVTKLINLPSLKAHNTAGVTLALKNLSHGLVNNVSRSHTRLAEFIPAVIALPVIRDKTVLHILDGTRALYDGGPGIMKPDFVWTHGTAYFATDPVAMDAIGRSVIDEKRRREGLQPVAVSLPGGPTRQPEYVESCAKAGFGECELARIELRKFKL